MFNFNSSPYKGLLYCLFHIVLGILSTYNNIFIIGWVYGTIIFYGASILRIKKDKTIHLIYLITYLAPFELVARMAQTSPYLPYEFGRYLIIIFSTIGFFIVPKKKFYGLFLLFFLIPSLFFDKSNSTTNKDLLFNLLGPVSLCLIIGFFSNVTLCQRNFINIVRLLTYSAVTVLSFTLLKNPDFDEFEFTLNAQFATSGGFGSNQVSTILGFGILLFSIVWINNWKLIGLRIFDLIMVLAFLAQGLLTFSRGGIVGGILGIATFMFFLVLPSKKVRQVYKTPNVKIFIIPTFVLLISTFFLVNDITNGTLVQRFQGETSGTLSGSKEKDLNTITTGRMEIFISDITLWQENIVFGMGVGASRYLRSENIVAHVELSRLLSEHGLLGLFFFISLLIIGLKCIRKQPHPVFKGIIAAFLVIAIFTTFHAAMRTFLTPLLFGIISLRIDEKKTG